MVAPIINTGIQTAKVRVPKYIFQMMLIDCNYSSIAMVRDLHTGVQHYFHFEYVQWLV
jgi:hypothetical protein